MAIQFQITVDGERALVETPYHAEFISRVKKMGGKWDAERKVWTVDVRDIEAVRTVMREIFGRDDSPTDLVSVRVRVVSKMLRKPGPITMFGRTVASYAAQSVHNARIGEGVVFVSGWASSDGVGKKETRIIGGSEIIIHDVPRAVVDAGMDVPTGIEYEIMQAPVDVRREELCREKACLLGRISKIEEELRRIEEKLEVR